MSNTVTMYDLFTHNGKVNVFGWLVFVVTITALFITIFQNYKSIQQLKRDEQKFKLDEESQAVKMKELEFNLKSILGDKYQVI